MNEQHSAVVESDEQVTTPVVPPVSEDNNAQDDVNLDALLNEWSEEVEEPKAAADPVESSQPKKESEPNKDEFSALVEFVKSQKAQSEADMRKQVEREYQDVVKALKADLPVSETIVDGYLQKSAQSDPRIAQAYQNREKNPARWEKTMKGIQANLRKEIGNIPDKAVTQTRNAVVEAIQVSKSVTNQPTAQNWSQKSDRDFFADRDRELNS